MAAMLTQQIDDPVPCMEILGIIILLCAKHLAMYISAIDTILVNF